MTNRLQGLRLLLGVCSSIAAHRALDLASALRKDGAEVRVVLTEHVPNLIGPAAFDAITHQRTIVSLWDSPHSGEMDHLAATKWANVFAVLPATANTLGQLAHGLAPDALTTLALAWGRRPLILAPAMNPEMWSNPAVQSNVATLRALGHHIVGPAHGRMACDDIGAGRLSPIEEIAAAIEAQWRHADRPRRLAGRRVLVTAGPTREFADDVRCITNPSTGKQGIALAAAAAEEGADVTLILGPTIAAVPPNVGRTIRVTTADEMLAAVLANLPQTDIAYFAAAVSDWKPAERVSGKEKKTSAGDRMTIELVRTPDIAATANDQRRPGQLFIGFAAESENLAAYANGKMQRKGFAIVFANPINETGAGFGTDTNRGLILRADGSRDDVGFSSKADIARRLLDETVQLLAVEPTQSL